MSQGEPIVGVRRATADDAPLIYEWRREPAVKRFQPLRDLSLEEARRSLSERARHRLGPELDGEVQWVIEAGGVPSGWITLRIVYRAHGVGELGYSLSTPFHRRGYMSAALHLVLPLAFDPTAGANLWRLEASVAVDNVGSRTVLERAGFQLEGVAHASAIIDGRRVDHARYALLRPDWLHSQRLSGG